MSKGLRALMMSEKGKNKGFTIIELITAIAILGVLSVTVGYLMNSSSKTYKRLSVESQLQSEAQLVANAITELAIDSFTATDELPADFIGESGNKCKGGSLVLETTVEGTKKKQYMIQPVADKNALYLVQREYNATTKSWEYDDSKDRELLANYITGFSVDTSRVEKENILEFSIAYEKDERTYQGNYQVLMRNRAFADKEKEKVDTPQEEKVLISLEPQVVYLDVVGDEVPSYYTSSIADANKHTMTQTGVPFSADVVANSNSVDKNVHWELKNEDDTIFKMSKADAESSNLTWDLSGDRIKKSAIDMFTLVITKSYEAKGGVMVEASPKTAQILLRRIKSLDLYALSGAVQWKDQYSDVFGGVMDPSAHGYAYKNNKGQYLPINLNASVLASNISYGGGLTWELYRKNEKGDWVTCNDSTFAKLSTNKTETSTSNVVTIGPAAENGQLYRVVATSIFDPSYKDEYIFGIAPSGPKNDDGFYSRGFYTDMGEMLKKDADTWKSWQSDQAKVSNLVFLKVTKVDCGGKSETSDDKISVRRDADGTWRLYIDYDAFAYSAEQKETFYNGGEDGGGISIHITIGYYDQYGHLCITGQDSDKYAKELEDQEGRKICTGSTHHEGCSGGAACTCKCVKEGGKNEDLKICYGRSDIQYKPKAVEVVKTKPVKPIIVLEKGKSTGVSVQTLYYNIISKRKGTYYFGAYIDDMYNNLLEDGKGSTHAYFNVDMASDYGDTDRYVDKALVELTAKPSKDQAKYLIQPKKLRFAANDFYLIKIGSPNKKSYTDYEVLLANVKGQACYIPGPESIKAEIDDENIYWSATEKAAIEAGTETEVTGLNTSGETVTAKITKKSTKYYCEYNGKTYLYNSAYNCWQ